MTISFKQYLTELFDKPFKLSRVVKNPNSSPHMGEITTVAYDYRIPKEKKPLQVFFDKNEGSDIDRWDIMFTRSGSIDVTGKGNANRIFASVLDAFSRFVDEFNPEVMTFTADKSISGSRSTLYNAMISRFASKMGYKENKSKTKVNREKDFFYLERKKMKKPKEQEKIKG